MKTPCLCTEFTEHSARRGEHPVIQQIRYGHSRALLRDGWWLEPAPPHSNHPTFSIHHETIGEGMSGRFPGASATTS